VKFTVFELEKPWFLLFCVKILVDDIFVTIHREFAISDKFFKLSFKHFFKVVVIFFVEKFSFLLGLSHLVFTLSVVEFLNIKMSF